MNLTFRTDIANLRLSPPIMKGANAESVVTDTEEQPFLMRIQTTMNTDIRNAKTRGYVDLDIPDDRTLGLLQSLDNQMVDIVFANQSKSDWFGKDRRAPRGVIDKMLSRVVCSTDKKPHPYLRLKTDFQNGTPLVNHVVACSDAPDDTTSSTVHSFADLQGTLVTYEVQLTGIRFCKTAFNPKLKLVQVTSLMDVKSYNMLDGILNNDNHRDRKERILQQQERMQQYEAQRAELEDMKQTVESEVHAVMTKQTDIDTRYKELLNVIEQSRLEYETDGVDCGGVSDAESDAAEAAAETAVAIEAAEAVEAAAGSAAVSSENHVAELALVPASNKAGGNAGAVSVVGEVAVGSYETDSVWTTDAALLGE